MRLRRAVWAIGLPEAEMDPPTCSSQPDGKGYAADGHIVAAISGAGPASVTLRLDLPIRCLLAVPSRPCGPDHGEGKAPKLASCEASSPRHQRSRRSGQMGPCGRSEERRVGKEWVRTV